MIINVSFSDATKQTVNMYFGCPQDETVYPYQGQIETSDPRWKAFYDSIIESLRSGLPEPDASA
jgi:hypothetical protein